MPPVTACIIPQIPNGFIISIEDDALQTVGDSSDEFMPVKVVCNNTYQLFHERANQSENICFELKWQHQWAQCLSKLLKF